MSTPKLYATDDAALLAWLNNFNAVASDNASILGITFADLQPCINGASVLQDSITQSEAARAAALAATNAKTDSRQTAAAAAIAMSKRLLSTPGVSDALKLQLGLTVPAPRRRTVPLYVPQDVLLNILPTTQVELTWTPGGNAVNTTYLVEKKTGANGAWTCDTYTTTTRYVDSDCPPGTPTYYRVSAQRTGRTSAPSASAVVYSGGTSEQATAPGVLTLSTPTQIAA